MKIILSIITVITSLFCKAQEGFEGYIVFNVSTELKDPNNPYKDYYLKKYGDSALFVFTKEGSRYEKFISSSETGIDWRMYDQETNTYYAKWKQVDTLYYVNGSEIMSELIDIKDGPSMKILGTDCKSITVSTFDPIGKENLIISYFYSGNEKIPAMAYDNLKEGYMNQVYAKTRSHIIGYHMDLSHVCNSKSCEES